MSGRLQISVKIENKKTVLHLSLIVKQKRKAKLYLSILSYFFMPFTSI